MSRSRSCGHGHGDVGLPVYKKEYLPHGLCHFYLRHQYCNNRNCKWDHPPLGNKTSDRPEHNPPHRHPYNNDRDGPTANGNNGSIGEHDTERPYHNRDDFQSYADVLPRDSNHISVSRSNERYKSCQSHFDPDEYDRDNHRKRDRDKTIKCESISSKTYDANDAYKSKSERDSNRRHRSKSSKASDHYKATRPTPRERSRSKPSEPQKDDVKPGVMDIQQSEVEEGEIQEDFVVSDTALALDAVLSEPTAIANNGIKDKKKKMSKKKNSNKEKKQSKALTVVKHEKSHKKSNKTTKGSSECHKDEKSLKSKKKDKTKSIKTKPTDTCETSSTVQNIPPPPPPKQDKDEEQISECPDWINKQKCDSFRTCPYFHDGVECDKWVEYGKCPEKEQGKCKVLHHRSIWIQAAKDLKEKTKKREKTKQRIEENTNVTQIAMDTKDTSKRSKSVSPAKNHADKKRSKSREGKRKSNKKEKKAKKKDKEKVETSTAPLNPHSPHKSPKDSSKDNGKSLPSDIHKRASSVDSVVSVSSIASDCSDQTRELQVLKINVAKMVKKKRKIYKTELKQMYYDTFREELNIEDYGYWNIVSFLKSIKCLAMHQGSNGSPLIVYNSSNINNLRHRKLNKNRAYNGSDTGYQSGSVHNDQTHPKMYAYNNAVSHNSNVDNVSYPRTPNHEFQGKYNGYDNGYDRKYNNDGDGSRGNHYDGSYAPNGAYGMHNEYSFEYRDRYDNGNVSYQNEPYANNGYDMHNRKRPFHSMQEQCDPYWTEHQREPPNKKRRRNSNY